MITGGTSPESPPADGSGPTGASLPGMTSAGVTGRTGSVPPFTSPAKTTASPPSLLLGRTTQSTGIMSSAFLESTSGEIAHSEQRTSASPSPQANGILLQELLCWKYGSSPQLCRGSFFQESISRHTHLRDCRWASHQNVLGFH